MIALSCSSCDLSRRYNKQLKSVVLEVLVLPMNGELFIMIRPRHITYSFNKEHNSTPPFVAHPNMQNIKSTMLTYNNLAFD